MWIKLLHGPHQTEIPLLDKIREWETAIYIALGDRDGQPQFASIILFRAASLVVDTIRTFFLIVLSVLGPFAFAVSVFDGFQGTLVQWLARYISVYLWLPISDRLGVMLAKIQTLVLQSEMEMIRNPLGVFSPDGSTAIYLVFMLIGLVGYFCVPTVANWVVQAGGMGAYNRNMNNTASKAANVGGAVAGASTGNVAGVLLKK